jgi:rRNA processing protein Krr1/Pno1
MKKIYRIIETKDNTNTIMKSVRDNFFIVKEIEIPDEPIEVKEDKKIYEINGKKIAIQSAENNILLVLKNKKWGDKQPETIEFKNGVIKVPKKFIGRVVGEEGRIIKALEKVYGDKILVQEI